jgi:Protein of unknown function (DUF1553)/Protein of unknown function (DUF1549)/Planctomycete cytochrome C
LGTMHWKLMLCATALVASGAAQVRFNRDIRPIMAETCFRCHGPDKAARMAGMRLDIREEALKPTARGNTPIVPGDPDKSAIVQRIFAKDARVMPPASIHKDLTQEQKDTIRRWVAEGAQYEGHWSYQPVHRPAVPAGGVNPIDAFIRERLAREGLKPSPEADRITLIRRVTLDLTGVPPTPEEVAAFVKDGNYNKLVDRLMESPRYAEQQTMHWLDAVRYADTCGFHGDNAFPAWPYRDYVLHAFLENKPFDQFTREQLAGDLIPNATREQKVASAFNRLNRTSAEGGLQPKEYLAKYGADRVRTVSGVWLGGTLGCAECHDHKFDPYTARDFYSMKAFFADIKETGLVPDRGKNAWGALLPLPTPEQEMKLKALQDELAAARARLADKMKSLEPGRAEWEKQILARYEAGELAWKNQHPLTAKSANGAELTIHNDDELDFTVYDGGNLSAFRAKADGLVIASGPNPDNDTYTVTFKPGVGKWRALGIELVQDESLPGIRLARGSDRVVISELELERNGTRIPFRAGMSNVSNQALEHLPIAAFDGNPKTGWAVNTYNEVTRVMLALRLFEPLETRGDEVLTVRIRQEAEQRRATMGRFRIALSPGEYAWPNPEKGKEIPANVLRALRAPESERTEQQKDSVASFYQWANDEAGPEVHKVAQLELATALLEQSIPRVMVSQSVKPAETRILRRGNFLDESGDVVEPAIPAFLGKLDTSGRATRLDLANWLIAPDNPLTPRVYANRVWRQFFGTGLSKVLDDLGSQGEWPTHPELLDWLAAEFVKPEYQAAGTHAWDMKHLVRTIVTSATYKQSSMPVASDEKDPDNRLLARQNRFRVDAEVVRDIALSVSGLMVERFGGPSAKPYQPDGYLATLNFPKREYSASHGDDLYRRGVYTFWQRSFLHPSMANFDAPTREECTVNRTNSNTPLQALDLLNDPIYVETARVFAAEILKHGGSIDWAFQRAVSRAPTEEERRILTGLRSRSLAQFKANASDAQQLISEGEAPISHAYPPAELAAMTTVARAILNMHETITRN